MWIASEPEYEVRCRLFTMRFVFSVRCGSLKPQRTAPHRTTLPLPKPHGTLTLTTAPYDFAFTKPHRGSLLQCTVKSLGKSRVYRCRLRIAKRDTGVKAPKISPKFKISAENRSAVSINSMFEENLVGLGFLYCVSYIK